MTDTKTPQATVHKRGFAWIWLVPLVALVVVAWLGWQYFAKQGPTITIDFARADGLEAGRTQIKMKSVTVGLVKNIRLSKDLSHVEVEADMDRSMEDNMGPQTQFWVVRPRFSSGNISGLDTLVSGAYIGMQADHGDETYRFKGLDEAPVTLNDVPGTHFTLHTDHLSALDQGSTVYYRGIDVGAVQGYKLNEDGTTIDIYIFVRDPYAKFVTTDTRFWNANGIDVNTGPNGLEIKTESFRALLSGGITFDTPPTKAQMAAANSNFPLYESEKASDADPVGPKFSYLINFPGFIHGLGVRAPVELNGVRIGRVIDISQKVDIDTGQVSTPIIIEIERDKLVLVDNGKIRKTDDPQAQVTHALDMMVRKGFRAELATASLLTGQRFVQITARPDAEPAKLIISGKGPAEIPAVESGTLDDMTRSATIVLKNANHVVTNLGTLTGAGNGQLQDTVKSLDGTVKDLDRVLNNVDNDLRPLGNQLPEVLNELRDATRSVRSLVDFVDEHPEALLRGRSDTSDSGKDQ